MSGTMAVFHATGTETEVAEKSSDDATGVATYGSLFIEKTLGDRLAIGVDYVPMTADVSDKTYTRNDIETSVTDTATTSSTSRSQKASAELSDHMTVYADVMINDEVFVKFGGVQVELETKDSLGTGSKYGDETVNGYLIGVGTKKDVDFFGKFIKLEVIYTDYDDISITSSVARTGVTTNNKITADLDTTQFKVSYAF